MTKKNFLSAVCAFALAVLFIFQSGNLNEGIRKGLYTCSYYVIPAVFPFMALSVFICKSAAGEFFSAVLAPLTKVFKLPACCGKAILAAAIGGYPTGAKCINDLVLLGEIDRRTAARMLCFCVNAGPPFLVAAVGVGIFGSVKIGLLLFAAQMISAVIISAATAVFSEKPPQSAAGTFPPKGNAAAILVESIISAAESCFRMCAFIVLAFGVMEFAFSGGVFSALGQNPLGAALFAGFFEVTAGSLACKEIAGFGGIIAAGAVASFSGISVILQVAAVTDESKISLTPFIISRFFHAGITAALLRVFLAFSGEAASAIAMKNGQIEALLSASAPAAVSLLCMASLFLLSIVPPKSEKEGIFSQIKSKFPLIRHSNIK